MTSANKIFNVAAAFLSLVRGKFLSGNAILLWIAVSSERKAFTVFQKSLLSKAYFSLIFP